MKKFYAILCIAIASLTQLQSQAPQGFNYQATVRNSSGDLIVNTNVYFKFNVIQGSQTAVPIFTETHYVPTDDLGQVNLVIGQGTANTGTFSELDWSQGSYYLGIELNTGSGYVAMGTTQLLSVPYALYAQNSGNSTTTPPNLQLVLAENNSANNQQIKDLQDPTDPKDAVNLETLELQIELLNNQIDDLQNQLTDIYQNLDADGDGFTPNDGDCDDSNSSIYPGANEFCDNIDNNCNAQVDENPVDGTTWYLDSDGDGYGFIQLSVLACSQPDGYVANSDDCDDSNSNIYPGADEFCDNIDNNCNAQVDENPVDGTTWYLDSDGDGFGFIQLSVLACSQPDGYVANSDDCDDNNSEVFPGATEIEDDIDNNCDGIIDDCYIIEADQFIGEYTLATTATGIFGSAVFVNGTVTISMGATPTDRTFLGTPYPEFGAFPAMDFNFSLLCGNVQVPAGQDTGVGCGSSTTLGPAANVGSYDPADDSSFTIIITDDEAGSCGSPFEAAFLLTKI